MPFLTWELRERGADQQILPQEPSAAAALQCFAFLSHHVIKQMESERLPVKRRERDRFTPEDLCPSLPTTRQVHRHQPRESNPSN